MIAAAIIPLGHGSHRDSSSLPEGSLARWLTPSRKKHVFVRRRAQRAGPALPSYLALHHAGFSVPPVSPPERWALTPPFHPCQNDACSSKTSRRFPCAMPPCCAPPAVYSLWHFPWRL